MTRMTYSSLAGRVVLITGGASGIGAALVRAFATQGARVAFLDIDASAGEALVRDVAATTGSEPLFVPCDLLDIDTLRAAMARVRGSLGDAAVLVNNAANDQRQVLAEVTPAEFDWTIGVNLKHVFFAAQAVVPQMQARGGGSIINMSSVAGCAVHPRCRSTPRRRRRSSASPTRWRGRSAPTASASTRSRRGW